MARTANSPALDASSRWWCLAAAGAAVVPIGLLLPATIALSLPVLFGLATLSAWSGWRTPGWIRLLLTLAGVALVLREYGVGFGGGFGRDTGAALLAVMLALKLLETTALRDARTLLSFALFAIMGAFLQDQGPLTLTLALLATLLVVAALRQVARLDLPDRSKAPAEGWRRSLRNAIAMAMLSAPLALVGFWLFPRLASPLWGLPQNALEARTGLSDEMTPGDIAQLYADDSPALRVRFEGETPPPSQLYWRGPVLTQFDGRRWSQSGWSSALDPAPLTPLGEAVTYEVEQEPTERRYVIALDLPTVLPPDTRMGLERTVLARRPLVQVSRHTLVSQPRYRFEPVLRQTLRGLVLALPTGFNPRARELAQRWRAEAGDDRTVIGRALTLFNAGFTYTLNPQLLGRHSVDDFLFNTRAGYCEHFASAFVVLMRAAGIPARVVTGYQGGYLNPLGGYLVIRQSDAHAWAEVWLEGEGWVRVDPTSAVAPERIERGSDVLGREGSLARGWARPLLDTADWVRRGWNEFVLGFDAARQSGLLSPLGIERADWRQLSLALIVAGGLAAGLTLLLMLRKRGPRPDPLTRAYASYLRRLRRAGIAKAPHEGHLAYAERVAARLPASAQAVRALSARYARQRYARVETDPPAERALCDDLRGFRVTRE